MNFPNPKHGPLSLQEMRLSLSPLCPPVEIKVVEVIKQKDYAAIGAAVKHCTVRVIKIGPLKKNRTGGVLKKIENG